MTIPHEQSSPDMTHFPDPDKIQLELEKGSGICRIGQVPEETLSGAVEDWFLSLARRIGTPVSQSTDGDLVLSIKNKSFGEHDSRTRGPNTNRKLGFHTDRCDVIGFLCLQPAKIGGENQVVGSLQIEKIIRLERPDLHEILCQPFPYKRHVIDQGNSRPFCEQPIFSWKENFFACSYLRVLIDRANDDEQCPNLSALQRESLDFLDCVCERENLQTRFTLKRGEIVFLNNWTTLHRRTAFEDEKEEEKRRHLLRVWISVPNSRPLDESFRANFGSTEAGAVRGGILPIA
tara:strand:- start:100 stop:969 length:870 start_codon:yes stop_codon:yes gene_type:complete